MISPLLPLLLAAALIAASPSTALSQERIAGPVHATVIDVIDGDTLAVETRPWLSVYIRTNVRVGGIDSPEMRGKCAEELHRARAAKKFIEARLEEANSRTVVLHNIQSGKYAGRVVADVFFPNGDSWAALMLGGAHARPYGRRVKRASWCR